MKKISLFILCSILLACEKDNTDNELELKNDIIPVIAGTTDTSMIHGVFNPEIMIDYVWSECGYGDGTDSIDLLADGIYDFRISARFLDDKAFFECCPETNDCWPSGVNYTIQSINEIDILIYEEEYDAYTTFKYVDALSLNDRIDTMPLWIESNTFWSLNRPLNGTWYNIDEEDRYMAIRSGDSLNYKYGWIKIGINSDHNLIFKAYAIQK